LSDFFGVLLGIFFFFQIQTIKNEKLFLLNILYWAENTSQIPAEVINFMSSLLSFSKYVYFIYINISLEKKFFKSNKLNFASRLEKIQRISTLKVNILMTVQIINS